MTVRFKKSAFQFVVIAALTYMAVRMLLGTQVGNNLVSNVHTEYDVIPEEEDYRGNNIPYQPFQPDQPRSVVILTYQRSGSTFFGQLFNQNSGVFYLYEPLDSLYTALYGTQEGWNAGQDITAHWDGSERVLPHQEKQAAAVFLRHLLSCKLTSLPSETLVHHYWWQFAGEHKQLGDFHKCLRQHNLKGDICQRNFTIGYCGRRFGEKPQSRLDTCNQYLWNATFLQLSKNPIARNFTSYKKCITGMRETAVKHCTSLFTEVCESSQLRAAKSVRGTMDSMGPLLRELPNFRVIHLYRDPRAVVLSRHNFDSSGRSTYSRGNVILEAGLYCRTVVNDVRSRRRLDKAFPGRILPVIYDDLVLDPLGYTERIYQFLNSTLPDKTIKWIVEHTQHKKNSTTIANKWKDKLTFGETKKIMDECKEFFEEIPYKWLF